MKSSFFRFIALFLFSMIVGSAFAQSNSEQISWGDDDDEEEEFVLEIRDEALILINGEEMAVTDNVIEFPRNETLEIKIRHMQPGTFLSYKVEKTGLKLKSQRFQANQKGELDLEVGTGKKKGGAHGTISYFSSSGKRVVIKAKIKII